MRASGLSPLEPVTARRAQWERRGEVLEDEAHASARPRSTAAPAPRGTPITTSACVNFGREIEFDTPSTLTLWPRRSGPPSPAGAGDGRRRRRPDACSGALRKARSARGMAPTSMRAIVITDLIVASSPRGRPRWPWLIARTAPDAGLVAAALPQPRGARRSQLAPGAGKARFEARDFQTSLPARAPETLLAEPCSLV